VAAYSACFWCFRQSFCRASCPDKVRLASGTTDRFCGATPTEPRHVGEAKRTREVGKAGLAVPSNLFEPSLQSLSVSEFEAIRQEGSKFTGSENAGLKSGSGGHSRFGSVLITKEHAQHGSQIVVPNAVIERVCLRLVEYSNRAYSGFPRDYVSTSVAALWS
jgi:hypothetical protein